MALPPRLIKAHLDRLPYSPKTGDDFRGVDGTQTPRAQWYNPHRSLLLEPLSEEQKEEARKIIEEHAWLVKEGKLKELPQPLAIPDLACIPPAHNVSVPCNSKGVNPVGISFMEGPPFAGLLLFRLLLSRFCEHLV